jgi:hypothetical protein
MLWGDPPASTLRELETRTAKQVELQNRREAARLDERQQTDRLVNRRRLVAEETLGLLDLPAPLHSDLVDLVHQSRTGEVRRQEWVDQHRADLTAVLAGTIGLPAGMPSVRTPLLGRVEVLYQLAAIIVETVGGVDQHSFDAIEERIRRRYGGPSCRHLESLDEMVRSGDWSAIRAAFHRGQTVRGRAASTRQRRAIHRDEPSWAARFIAGVVAGLR